MKYILIAFLLTILMLGCRTQQSINVEAEKAAIKTVLDNYIVSVENEDMDLYGDCVAHDSAMVNFGAMGGPIVGWDALVAVMKAQNEALSDTKIVATNTEIHITPWGKTAWATSLWNLSAIMGENPLNLDLRCTWVLEKRMDKWIIVHFHKSAAMG